MVQKDIHEVREELERLNLVTAPYKFAAVTENDIILLDRNARYMTKEQLNKLVNNIKGDGFLTQLPLGMKREEDGKYVILSGNHRCKASIKAKLDYFIIQYIDEVDKDKALSLQLSHNSIVGQDDMSILKELYQEIESLEAKEFAGIDEKALLAYDSLEIPTISEANLEFNTISFIFSDTQVKDYLQLEKALNELGAKMPENDIKRYSNVPYKEFVKILSDVKDHHGVKNNTVGFVKMLQICREYLDRESVNKENDTK